MQFISSALWYIHSVLVISKIIYFIFSSFPELCSSFKSFDIKIYLNRCLIIHLTFCIVSQDDLKEYGRKRGWCPYFLARYSVSSFYWLCILTILIREHICLQNVFFFCLRKCCHILMFFNFPYSAPNFLKKNYEIKLLFLNQFVFEIYLNICHI